MSSYVRYAGRVAFEILRPVIPNSARKWYKEFSEISFWKTLSVKTDGFTNGHFEYFYTRFFDLEPAWYGGKSILDVGCGPLGSLEWADMAKERIGLDPLVDRYKTLGIDRHKMSYCHAEVERIPYPDGKFDVVTTFNSLDHVDDIDKAIEECVRVVAPGGTLLMIVEVNHRATATEPIEISERTLRERMANLLSVRDWRAYDIRDDHQIYRSLTEGAPTSLPEGKPGIVAARFENRL
jgi:2-polyprenyl-3-methyl-5-hydroxy-6-metoxy-1,4-benzoquinol methylase